jgi:hypothetical protein
MSIDMKAVRKISLAFSGGLWMGTTGREHKLTADQVAKLEQKAEKFGQKLARSIQQQ